MKTTVVAIMDIFDETLLHSSTEFFFYKKHKNALDYIFDEYFNSVEWEIDEIEGENIQLAVKAIFTFINLEYEDHKRMLIVEDVLMDEEEQELFADIIEFED